MPRASDRRARRVGWIAPGVTPSDRRSDPAIEAFGPAVAERLWQNH
jgi:hypothetical protein